MLHIPEDIIKKTLANKPDRGKRSLEPIKSIAKEGGIPLEILEDVNVVNEAEVHMQAGDLWQCLEGEVIFTCGGELVEPYFKQNSDGSDNKNELKAKEIKNGKEIILKIGDWLWIPPGEPHQHKTTGVCRLAIIKIPKC